MLFHCLRCFKVLDDKKWHYALCKECEDFLTGKGPNNLTKEQEEVSEKFLSEFVKKVN